MSATPQPFDSRELRHRGPTIVRWEDSSQPISQNLQTGLVLPVLTSATGLAFAAWLPPEMTAPLIDAELARESEGGVGRDAGELSQRLARVRETGLVRLAGTNAFADLYGTSISAISVPVFDQTGAMVLALTAIGASDRLDSSEAGALVTRMRHCAATLSQRLGARLPGATDDPQELPENRP